MADDDPHVVMFPHGHKPAWRVVYWRGNMASGAKDADRAELEVWNTGFGYARIGEYLMPDESHDLVCILNALERTHEAGMRARSDQFKRLLEH